MADNAETYKYGQRRSLLLRMNTKTRVMEVFRPKLDTWEEYDWDGALETWYDCTAVDPDHVEALKNSLKELDAA